MIPRKLPAAQGLVWARQALQASMRNPRAVFGAALLLALTLYAVILVARLVAGIGGQGKDPAALLRWLAPTFLLMMVLLPVLLAGLMHVIREADAGRPVHARDLYAPFRRGKTGALAALGLVQLLLGALGAVMVVALAGNDYWSDYLSALRSVMNGGSVPVMPQPRNPLLLMLAQLLFNYFSYALMLFSIPLILFSGARLRQALAGSMRAALRNVAPNMVAAFVLLAGVIVATLLLGVAVTIITSVGNLIHPAIGLVFGSVLLFVYGALLLVVLGGGALFAWRDTFGDDDAAAPAMPIAGIEV